MVPFAAGLAAYGDRVALCTAEGEVSYRALADRVDAVAQRLAGPRRLVLLAARNTVDSVVGYLAALAAGQPLLVVAGDQSRQRDAMVAAYDPDIVLDPAGGLAVDVRRKESAHLLHPDLALLLSTSGSTGSPKLVRLSHDNLQANAEAIADYLGIRDTDRAATTLPLHYCYGLSVLHSHLLRGAGLILTSRSVVEPCFWDLFRRYGGTSFAGVPYTFELLQRVGFAELELPTLRYVTQAGGRLAPALVRRYASLASECGWDFVVMYGQTEATARMAYLPPELAGSQPEAIGVPIPGGAFRLAPVPEHPDPEVGELMYAGPNVMLGYAETPADLARGREIEELATGDLARRTADGLYQIVGRRGRFAKVYGQRIDLQHVELSLESRGLTACCAGTDQELVVAVTGAADTDALRREVAAECGLPPRTVRVVGVDELPRLPTGKPDYAAVAALDAEVAAAADADPLRALYAELLDCPDVTDDDSFVGLGGDSLSYVELSIRLEKLLGRLPDGWHTMPIRDLRQAGQPSRGAGRRRWVRMLDTSVALRAIAIVLIVGTHIKLFAIVGGAHLLFGVAGFNFARFQLTDADREGRLRHVWGAIRRIALPSMLWITGAIVLTRDYAWPNAFLLNSLLGPRGGRVEWHFWFVEALVYILVALAVLLAVPAADRLERRVPFGLPLALLATGLIMRYDLLGIADRDIPSAIRVFWLFALGWAGAKAAATWQRLVVSAAVVGTVPGFFGNQPQREAIIVAGLLLLIWVPSVPGVAGLNRVAGVLAGSSLYIYVTHWQVFPRIDDYSRPLALAASLVVGIVYGYAIGRLATALRGWRTHRERDGEPSHG